MDEYEPITDELRAYVRRATSTTDTCWWMASNTHDVLDLCDNIDAVHAQLERENESLRKKVKHQSAQLTEVQDALERRNEGELKRRWQKELDRLKAERDSMAAALDAAQGEHAFAPESHYMMLPKDADGKPVHVGDVMEWCDSGETIAVEGVGNDILFYIDGESSEWTWTAARNKRHHHKPTVEDVLAEFANRVCNSGHQWGLDTDIAIAEFAKKLQLKEEA